MSKKRWGEVRTEQSGVFGYSHKVPCSQPLTLSDILQAEMPDLREKVFNRLFGKGRTAILSQDDCWYVADAILALLKGGEDE